MSSTISSSPKSYKSSDTFSGGLKIRKKIFLESKRIKEDQLYEERLRCFRSALKEKYKLYDKTPRLHPNYHNLSQRFREKYKYRGVKWQEYWEKHMDEDYYEKVTEGKLEIWKKVKEEVDATFKTFNASLPELLPESFDVRSLETSPTKNIDKQLKTEIGTQTTVSSFEPNINHKQVSKLVQCSLEDANIIKDDEKVFKLTENEMQNLLKNCISLTAKTIADIHTNFEVNKKDPKLFAFVQNSKENNDLGSFARQRAAAILSGDEEDSNEFWIRYIQLFEEEQIDSELQSLKRDWKKLLLQNLENLDQTTKDFESFSLNHTKNSRLEEDEQQLSKVKQSSGSQRPGISTRMKNHGAMADTAETREQILKQEFDSSFLKYPPLMKDQQDIDIDMKYLLAWIHQLRPQEVKTLLNLQSDLNPENVSSLQKYLKSISDLRYIEKNFDSSMEVKNSEEINSSFRVKKKLEITEPRKKTINIVN